MEIFARSRSNNLGRIWKLRDRYVKECGKDMSPADLICYNRTATQQSHAGSGLQK
jgi:hypothetical protein